MHLFFRDEAHHDATKNGAPGHRARPGRGRSHRAHAHLINLRATSRAPLGYFASHGVGFHPAASGNFLKCVLVMNGCVRYCGSVTIVVTTSHWSPLGVLKLSKFSSTDALAP